jgi:hypothetical protein
MPSRAKDLIVLLGAGASAEAGIPTSADMISRLESKLNSAGSWPNYRRLYNHVKSAIRYKEGLAGNFNDSAYNIETLANTLYELERNEEHPLYPFISAWNTRFVSIAGADFGQVRKFRQEILEALKGWMCPSDPSDGDYYAGLVELQRTLNFPLRVFSLNYDRCVERLSSHDFAVETGFSGFGPKHVWSYERFLETGRVANEPPQLFLYKLHGSIDWIRDPETSQLSRVEQIQSVPASNMEVIFGKEFKLEAADPYLFYAYEFRQYALEARLVLCIGYSFNDPHVNKMIAQALRADGLRQLLVVGRCRDDIECGERRAKVADMLEVEKERIQAIEGTAKEFLTRGDLGSYISSLVPQPDAPF